MHTSLFLFILKKLVPLSHRQLLQNKPRNNNTIAHLRFYAQSKTGVTLHIQRISDQKCVLGLFVRCHFSFQSAQWIWACARLYFRPDQVLLRVENIVSFTMQFKF